MLLQSKKLNKVDVSYTGRNPKFPVPGNPMKCAG